MQHTSARIFVLSQIFLKIQRFEIGEMEVEHPVEYYNAQNEAIRMINSLSHLSPHYVGIIIFSCKRKVCALCSYYVVTFGEKITEYFTILNGLRCTKIY